MWTLPAPAELENLLDTAADLPAALGADLSAPLAMAMPPEWQKSQCRTLIVGQETFGWDYLWPDGECESALLEGVHKRGRSEALIASYMDFDLSENGESRTKRSPFWRAHRRIAELFEGGDYRKVLWTNLSRCDTLPAKLNTASVWNNLSYENLDSLCKWQSPLLRAEIANSGAERVIFFTGPNYDYLLDRTLRDVRYETVFGDVSVRQAARIISPDLPSQSYRLYHPAYLQRAGLPHLDQLMDLMSA